MSAFFSADNRRARGWLLAMLLLLQQAVPATAPQAPTWQPNQVFTLDSNGDVGNHTSITIGSDGLGLISYLDDSNTSLKVAHCNNTACSSANAYTLDNTGAMGYYTSIAIGSDGLGLISYWEWTNGNLKVAHCSNTACSSATAYYLDTTGNVGRDTSIAIGSDGLGLISYLDATNYDLKVAHCNDTACSSATTYTLDSTGNVGLNTSITIGSDGLGLISYYDWTNYDLKVAHCSNTLCSSAATYTLDSYGAVGEYTSITIGSDNLGLISYYDSINQDLKVAHCSNTLCSSATTYTLDSTGPTNTGSPSSITIGSDGLGIISYYDWTNYDLKVAHCNNTLCSSASTNTLDSTGDVGLPNSIKIGSDGLSLISYYDYTNKDLKVAHCGNGTCTPPVFLPLVLRDYIAYFEGPNEIEDNDSFVQANGPIRSNNPYNGWFDDDNDYFSFKATAPGTISIDLTHNGTGVQLLLYNASGSLVGQDSGASPLAINLDPGTAGWFYARIYTTAPGTGASYTLTVTYP